MKKALLVASLLLVGCATTKGYEQLLQTWVGSTEEAIVRSWGPPDSVYERGKLRFLTYLRSSQSYVPGTSPTYHTNYIGSTAYTSSYGGTSGYTYTETCKTIFEIENNLIKSWRWEGNDCVAAERN